MTKPEDSMDELSLDQLVASVRKNTRSNGGAEGSGIEQSLRKGVVGYHAELYRHIYDEKSVRRSIWLGFIFGGNVSQFVFRLTFAAVMVCVVVALKIEVDNSYETLAINGYDENDKTVRSVGNPAVKFLVKSGNPRVASRGLFDKLKNESVKVVLISYHGFYSVKVFVDVVNFNRLESISQEYRDRPLELGLVEFEFAAE